MQRATRLGPYQIVAFIGAGGMGEVWRAFDPRLERDVALKVLPAEALSDGTARARLLREARLASRLNHPNVCTIHEVGEADGQTYIAMELVEGRPLSELLAAGPLPTERVVKYGQQLADGLAHAHEHGVVHRDLKSNNVVITPDGRAKVLDFGLASQLPEEDLEAATTLSQASLTAPGALVGTLAYMSPEQLRGRRADARSDVWALGVVLHEMATGKRPFGGSTSFELSSAILSQPAPPLPAGVPAPLAAVIARCLAKEPAERYQRGGEVRVALEALATGSLVSPWPAVRAAMVRHRWQVVLAGVVAALAIVAGLDIGSVRSRLLGRAGGAHAIRMAVLPFANLSGDPEQEYLADGFTQELISQLSSLRPGRLSVIARTSVMGYKQRATPVEQIGRELGVEYVLEGSTRREADRVRITAELVQVRDQAQLWAESYERELEGILALQGEVAREVARQVRIRLTPEQERRATGARQVNPRVYETYLRGSFYVSQNTPESFEKGIALLHEAVAIDPAEPLAYIGLAEGYITRGHGGGEQIEAFQRARAAAEQVLKLEPDRAEAIGILADVALYYEWDWAKAERLFQQALALNPSLAMTHYHYAWYLAGFNRLDEAIAEHKLARDLDPLRAFNTAWLGHLYNYGGRHDEAIVEATKAVELDPKFPWSYFVLRFAYSSKGMHKEAIAAARRHVEVSPEAGRVQLVTALALAGEKREALELLSKLDRRTLRHPAQLALMHLALGDRDAALAELEAGCEAHWATVWAIGIHGNGLDALRDEPRFKALLRKMNLPG